MHPTTIDVLLVEDSNADARLTIETLTATKILINVNHVRDGVEALDYLTKLVPEGKFPRPDLILLDLNMPRKSGQELLVDISTNKSICDIPVVILTTSSDEEDILKCYKLHANCYIQKPVDLDEFSKIVRSIENFWFNIVKLPPKPE